MKSRLDGFINGVTDLVLHPGPSPTLLSRTVPGFAVLIAAPPHAHLVSSIPATRNKGEFTGQVEIVLDVILVHLAIVVVAGKRDEPVLRCEQRDRAVSRPSSGSSGETALLTIQVKVEVWDELP